CGADHGTGSSFVYVF
nr:immunoglobulin light chain junction region [Macaca mulatta]MPO02963.1 immunoglobulin light chain junction region [Macaca mulatta]MPO02966.1 immunoglobulin light chain junction region [Macaca mulatta]MPO02976.1 immunoglobulin light chain junction region [Macaca mulatta]MPO03001.1 immunoglobulin light chain junction region [Macaca mulatta]